MSDCYIPQVGDRVRHQEWDAGYWCDVLAIDGDDLFTRSEHGDAEVWTMDDGWIKVEKPTPLPELWWNMYCDRSGGLRRTRREADHADTTRDRIAVIHIWTDADGVDHADIERVEQ